MKKTIALFFVNIVVFSLFAQKEDANWIFGRYNQSTDSVNQSCRIDFSNDTPQIFFINKVLPFNRSNASISDSAGLLRCFSNGENLYNRNYEIMENGDNFYPNSDYFLGVPYMQGFMLLPLPNNPDKVVHIYGLPKPIHTNGVDYIGYFLRYGIADFNQNNGLGKVVQKHLIGGNDTLLINQMTATRHGNGRDWWIMMPNYRQKGVFHRYILNPQGITSEAIQTTDGTDYGLGQACFSPDGNWYGRFNEHGNLPDSVFSTFDLYRFDRCTGTLSDHISRTYNTDGTLGKPGGIAFSNSSRFLYVSRWDTIYQYDLQAPHLLASETVVAAYDGFTADYGLPTRFYSLQLAPDNRIYCCVSNYNSRYLHVIESPDSAGTACNVQQHAVHLPVFTNFLIPNMPYYRLWAQEGGPCDTIVSKAVQPPAGRHAVRVFPNPASDAVQISGLPAADGMYELCLRDLTGRALLRRTLAADAQTASLPLGEVPDGVYILDVKQAGAPVFQTKLIVLR